MKITRSVVPALQKAGVAPTITRASKTFTGAANLGAVGNVPLFTITGNVLIQWLMIKCTTTLADTVDGATLDIGVTGNTTAFINHGVLDLDAVVTGSWYSGTNDGAVSVALGRDIIGLNFSAPGAAVSANIVGTVGTQAVTSGVLEFHLGWSPLSSDGAVALGTGMVAI